MFARSPLNSGFKWNHLREVWLIESNISGIDMILPTVILSHSRWLAAVTTHLGDFIISKGPVNQQQEKLIEEFKIEPRSEHYFKSADEQGNKHPNL